MNRVVRPAVVTSFKSANDELRGGRAFTLLTYGACAAALVVGLCTEYKGNSAGEHVLSGPQRYMRGIYERIVTGGK